MPRTYRRSYRRRTSRVRRPIRKRFVRRRRIAKPRRYGLMWPDRKLVKLRYVDTTTSFLPFAAAYTSYQEYKLNSAYDVNSAVGSTSIPGYSEYAQMYNVYRVMGAKIKTTFSLDSDFTHPLDVALLMTSLQWSSPSYTVMQEYTRGNRHVVNGVVTSQRPITLSMYRPLSKVWGASKSYRIDDDFQATIAGDPALKIYGYVAAMSPSATTTITTSLWTKTEITLYIAFSRRDNEVS